MFGCPAKDSQVVISFSIRLSLLRRGSEIGSRAFSLFPERFKYCKYGNESLSAKISKLLTSFLEAFS